MRTINELKVIRVNSISQWDVLYHVIMLLPSVLLLATSAIELRPYSMGYSEFVRWVVLPWVVNLQDYTLPCILYTSLINQRDSFPPYLSLLLLKEFIECHILGRIQDFRSGGSG